VDRKALVREYKESRRPMGVYRIRNLASGRALIGTSTDLPSILNRHRAQLRLNAHPGRALQADWNEFGADAFAFEVLDTLQPPEDMSYDPSEDLRVLEALWRERLLAENVPSYPAR